jgi:hypothetical protein
VSTPQSLHSTSNVISERPGVGVLLASGDSVPADGEDGYAPGCVFVHDDGAAGTFLYLNEGSATSADFNALPNPADSSASILATEAGTGITAGTGTVYKSSVQKVGGIIVTRILIDLTGLHSEATDLDIIGVDGSTNPAHLGRITAARNGTILGGVMRCLEVPAGGDPNIALYSATEATGVEDALISSLNETVIFDPAADWTIDMSRSITAVPAANEYLYLVQGDAVGTDADYTAGKFLIELYGY